MLSISSSGRIPESEDTSNLSIPSVVWFRSSLGVRYQYVANFETTTLGNGHARRIFKPKTGTRSALPASPGRGRPVARRAHFDMATRRDRPSQHGGADGQG